ncbi:MAG: LuxR C-terminal-related transcriptional regulator [Spirochaetaceae bacterium]|jgi:LuxR family maltose regulon positive regulatory protein|nr:LuxR C-terminal-related transcriptional regulator [Spirochaetaceae bacterium]
MYLERPHIDRLLEKAVQKPVILVTAGTGYGKTHAVYSFLQRYSVITVWLQLTERDNFQRRFWENFCSAISMINPETTEKLLRVGFPETERQFDRYLDIPRHDVLSGQKYVFVYDDFHLLRNEKVLHYLERSITSFFGNITSILISRSEPPLNLTKFQSRGLLAWITEDDLRFSREEMSDYFHIQNIHPSSETLSAVYHDTEGWAFAIHLAVLSLKNTHPDAVYVPQAVRSNIFKLIETEILSTVSEELRKFLIKLSLIDHLSRDLLGEIAGAPKLLKELERFSSFVRFDSYLKAYRLHPLFLEYLSKRQDELPAEEKAAVYLKTARWYAANNQKIDAITYYEKVEAYEELLDCIFNMPLIIPDDITQILLDVLDRAPRRIFDQYPNAWILHSRYLITLQRFDEAREEILGLIEKLEPMPGSFYKYRILSACYHYLGLIGLLTCLYTRDYSYPRYFERGCYYTSLSGHVLTPPLTVSTLTAYVCRMSSGDTGEPERCIEAITGMVRYVSQSVGGCTYGTDDLVRAELAFFKGDMPEAKEKALLALQKARERDQYEIENRALFYLMRISLALGDSESIEECLRQLEAQLAIKDYINRYTFYDIVTGWFYVRIGQIEKLAAWLKNDFEESDLNSLVYGLELLVKAKLHLAEKRYPAVLASLESQESRYGPGAFLFGKLEMKTLEAVCRYQLRDREGALRALETAYEYAVPNGFFMPFTELGKDMRTLIYAILKNRESTIPRPWLEMIYRSASAYAKKCFAVGEQYCSAGGVPAQQGSAVPLSRRELVVLTGLSEGLTREEIAGTSSISINTVKSVIKSIYNKLGAINRADAVRIATGMGLLINRGPDE